MRSTAVATSQGTEIPGLEHGSGAARYAGTIFAIGGVVTAIGNILNPTGGTADYHAAMASELANPIGAPAAWFTLCGSLLMVWALSWLLGSAWRPAPPAVQAGTRLAIIGAMLLVVQGAANLAMRTAATPYAAGAPVPIVRFSEMLYSAALPALALGLLLTNFGTPRLAPIVIRILGAVGMVALGLAGPLVDGLHIIAVWPLYLGGALVCLWAVWVGIRQAVIGGDRAFR